MDTEEARTELNRRLNILSSNTPRLTKRDLRSGLANLNQRKEIEKNRREIEGQKSNIRTQLCNLDKVNTFYTMGESEEPEYDLGIFKQPSMGKTRKTRGRGYFW